MTPISEETKDFLNGSIQITPSPSGFVISSLNEIGTRFLNEINVPSGSQIIGLDEEIQTVMDLVLFVDSKLVAGEVVMLVLDAPENRRLHRYLVPVPFVNDEELDQEP